ncbi:single-stranded DNA-binding protein [Parapusillimonas sp. JC17]|uniref:single-stranded DNA-binding protein n=1 Tax=Parapusillimonas sp. JC17 TaxID=3445768 RepID=UPI003FA0EE26
MAQLIGLARLGRDAETRYTPQGDAVTELSLAFTYGKKGQDGNRPTQWVKGSMWGQRGETLAPYLLKGTQVYVVLDEAHIQTFQKQDGGQGVALVGKVSAVEFASRPEGSGQGQQQTSQREAPPRQQQRPAAPQAPAANLADLDDDIPF